MARGPLSAKACRTRSILWVDILPYLDKPSSLLPAYDVFACGRIRTAAVAPRRTCSAPAMPRRRRAVSANTLSHLVPPHALHAPAGLDSPAPACGSATFWSGRPVWHPCRLPVSAVSSLLPHQRGGQSSANVEYPLRAVPVIFWRASALSAFSPSRKTDFTGSHLGFL